MIKKSDAAIAAGAVTAGVIGGDSLVTLTGSPVSAGVTAVALAAGLAGSMGTLYVRERRNKRQQQADTEGDER